MARGPQTTGNGQIQKRPNKAEAGALLKERVRAAKKQISLAVPQQIGPDRFIRGTITAITKVPELALCTQSSFFVCLLSTAQLGLMPSVPYGVWLIPRQNKGIWECTMVIDYRGLCVLARRSGQVGNIRGVCVHEGDHFEWQEGTEPRLIHRPDMTNPNRHEQPVPWAYGTVKIKGDDVPHFAVLSHAEIEKRRRVNSGTDSKYSPWMKWWPEQAKKTVIKQALKTAPMDTEDQLARALAQDEARPAQLVSSADDQVLEALKEQGIEIVAAEPSEPGSTPGGQLTEEEIAAGWELSPDGEMIPPPKEGGAA